MLANSKREKLNFPNLHGTLLDVNSPEHFIQAAYIMFASFCGASTVAIDNKIEQAMDLVKSHLMFAVREEVEVLKEQIKELIEKNSQLELENSILKAAATPETIAQLQNKPQPPSSTS